MNAATVAWALICFYADLMARTSWDAIPKIGWGLGAWLSGYWILKLILVREQPTQKQASLLLRRMRWLAIPIIIGSVWAMIYFEIPLRIGFEISRSTLNATAKAVLESSAPLHNQPGGLLQVSEARPWHGSVLIDAEGREYVFFDEKTPEAASLKCGKVRLGGGWYASKNTNK